MRLTALCMCGTLLAFSSLSQMTAGEEVFLGDQEFGPCTATLRPGGKCSPGEHDGRCPYLFSLPPLTVHFPQQLREMERIMQDLQKLKDSVDELREMCADCTVRRSDRGCGKQREHEKLDEGKSTRDDGMKWMNVSPEENDKDFRQKCGKDVKMEKMDSDNDAEERLILDENTRKKWEADKKSNKGVIKDNEKERTRGEETEKDGKTKKEDERKKGPSEQTKMTGANVGDAMGEKAAETNNDEEEVNRNNEEEEKDNSIRHKEDRLEKGGERTMTTTEKNNKETEENDPQMWRDETKKKEENTQGGDEIKMSGNQGELKDNERGQDSEEQIKEREKGRKQGQNEGKTKQTEAEKERALKEGELDQKSQEMEKETEMGSAWKDSDGRLSSSTATEQADFVSISLTTRSTTRLASRFESMDSIKAKIFTSSLPSPPLPSPTLSSITDVSRNTKAVYGPTSSTGPGAAGFPEPQSFDEEDLTTTTTVSGLTQQTTSVATGSNSPSIKEAGNRFQGHASSTTTITTSPHPQLNSLLRPTDKSRRTTKKNISSNTKTGMKPLPGKGLKPGENLKPAVKPQAEQKLKNPKNDRKPDRAPLPDKTKYNPKPPHKPTTNKSKKVKDSKQTQITKPNHPIPPDAFTTDKNMKNNQNQTVQNPKFYQKSVTPVPRTTTQSAQSVNTTRSDKDLLLDKKPGSDKVPDQNAKAEKKQLLTNKQKPENPETNQNPTPVQKPDPKASQTTTFTTKPKQKHPTESLDENHSHESESNSDSGQKTQSDHIKKPYNQKPKSSLKVPKINQKHLPGGKRESEPSKTAPPKPNQQPLTESVNKYDQNYTHEPESDPDSILQQVIKSETNTPPDVRRQSNKNITIDNQKPQLNPVPALKRNETATPKPKQHLTESEVKSDEPESDPDLIHGKKIKSDQINPPPYQRPETNKNLTKNNQKPKPGPESASERSETVTPEPNQRPTTESGKTSDISYTHELKSDPDTMPGKKITSKTNTSSDQRLEFNKKIPKANQKPKPDQNLGSKRSETATPKPNQHLTESEVKSEENPSHEPKSDSAPGQKIQSDHTDKLSDQKPKSSLKTSKIHIKPDPDQEPESERSETATPEPNQRPATESGKTSDKSYTQEPKSDPDLIHGQKIKSDQTNTPPDQTPETNTIITQINQRPNPDQEPASERSESATPEPNQKPATESGKTSDKNPSHESKSNRDIKTTNPGQDNTPAEQNPKLNVSKSKPKPGQVFKPTQKPKPPSQFRPQTRPIVKSGLKPIQRPKPEMQPKLNKKIKTHSDPPQISWTASNSIQNSQTTSGVVKPTAEVTRSQTDPDFSASMRTTITLSPKTSNSLETGPNPHRPPEDFTLSPNSRMMSDLRPQTTRQPLSIQTTTRRNKINRGILQSVFTSTGPGSTHPSAVAKSEPRTQTFHNEKEDRPSPSSHTTSSPSLVFGSTPPVTSGLKTPAAERSTPSTRELRVKINQVAAFLNNSLNPNRRSGDMFSKEQPEGTLEGDRPDMTDSKLPTSEPSKGRRDCSDHLLRGETKSGVYLVTPDLRSRSFPVFCDMKRDGGGWTLLQRRQDGSVSFNRTWAEYQSGFGQLDGGEFWLGNNMIHLLTRDRDMVLRIELEDFHGVKEYAQYEQFRVAGARLRFRLTVGGYSGTAGDALRFNKMYDHNNKAFTTPDRDHDRYPSGNCGAYYSSGWWFDACMAANLNGKYYTGTYKGVRDGIFWGTWHNILNEYYPTSDRQSFKTVRMMIRPKGFAP